MEIYVVQPGDTVDSIAQTQGVPVDTILYNNQIAFPYRLAIGQALLLSKGEPDNQRRSVIVGGYAYPFISRYVLEQTLPFLSDLYVFSYGFTVEGDLIPPALDDTFMITMARDYEVNPVLTLTPFGPDGMFNNYLISRIVNDMDAQNNLIGQLVSTVQQKGFEGVDIDFEYILAQDRVAFADFVANVRQAINAIGYTVSVALAPKIADDQPGVLYEGKDFALLGAAADSALLMTYEWGYTLPRI